MLIKHIVLLLLINFLHGSAFPLGKLALNSSLPPILMASIRMGIVFLCLLPFWRFEIPDKKYFLSLFGFSILMGVGVFVFMNLALYEAQTVSPIIIGAQLAIPFGVLASSFFINEGISIKKWFLIIVAFSGVFIIGFDPNLKNQVYALFLTACMALCFALSQVFARHLKNLDIKLTSSYMSLTGLIVLFIISYFVEGNSLNHIKNINPFTWLLILHSSILVTIFAHMTTFYLYKFYTVGQVLPFYSLFPIFGLVQTFLIFNEIPTLLFGIGGIIVVSSVFLLQKIK